MRLIALCAAVSGLLLSACASKPEAPGDFARADSNRDGYVSLNEWKISGGRDMAFMAVDKDRKGRLSEQGFYEAQRLGASAGADAEAARQASDELISSEIRNALSGRRDVNGYAVRVEAYQGNVQLSGTVRTDKEKRAVEDIARGVRGARQVFNTIIIQN